MKKLMWRQSKWSLVKFIIEGIIKMKKHMEIYKTDNKRSKIVWFVFIIEKKSGRQYQKWEV